MELKPQAFIPVEEVITFSGEESLWYVRGKEESTEEEPGDLQVVIGDAGTVLVGCRVVCDDVMYYGRDEQNVDT